MENMPQFSRLNSMGEEVGKPTPQPTSRIGVNNEQQVGVLYGHTKGGKVYNYLGQNKRVGDIVTPMVTHPKSGKTYKTLARVVSTRDANNAASGDTAAHLSNQGVLMKTIGPTDQTSLPGYYPGWGKDANAAQQLKDEARLNGASKGKLKEVSNYTKQARSESKQIYDNQQQDALMRRLNSLGD